MAMPASETYLLRAQHRHDSGLVEIDRGDWTWVRMRFSLLNAMHTYLEIVSPAGDVVQTGGATPVFVEEANEASVH